MTNDLPAHLAPSIASTGKLHIIDPNGLTIDTARVGAFLGTCFCITKSHAFLTAAHCIPKEPSHLVVVGSFEGGTSVCFVKDVVRHPTADLAILKMYEGEHCNPRPFGRLGDIEFAGEDFWAFGYPADVFGVDADEPTPRVFKGHVQRFVDYESPLGYSYRAIEMSIAAPPGLSGGPLFRTHPVVEPFGLVVENLETVTYLHSEVEEASDGSRKTERFQTVINYGIAVDLSAVRAWIDDNTA